MKLKLSHNIVLINLTKNIRTIGCQNVCTYIQSKGFKNIFLVHVFFDYGKSKINPNQLNKLIELLHRLDPDIIGVSLMSIAYNTAKSLSSVIKDNFPNIPLVWGGIHPTLSPENSIDFCDIVCRGEGEEPFYELVCSITSGKDICNIPNLWVRKKGEIIRNELRPYCQDLDARPYPQIDWNKTYVFDKDGFKPLTRKLYNKYGSMMGTFYDIMASRGCPYSCTYCSNSVLKQLQGGKGKIVRFRSVEHIISELKYVKENFPDAVGIDFQDDAFGAAPLKYLEHFAKVYKKEIALPFHIRIIPSMINEDKIKILKDAMLASANLGLQGSDRINKSIYNRNTNKERFLGIAQMLRKYNIAGRYDIITQDPFSEEPDEVEVIQTLMKAPKPYFLIEFPLAFLPKTRLTEKAIKDGLITEQLTYYENPTGWGIRGERFPILGIIRTMTPYTPSKFIKFFLRIYNKACGRPLIRLYNTIIYKPESEIIKLIIKNYKITYFTQKLLMLITRKQA